MIDESKLKPFDAEAAKRGVPVVVRLDGELCAALEVSEKTDWSGDHAALVASEGQLIDKDYHCWQILSEDDLFMIDAEPEQEEVKAQEPLQLIPPGHQAITGFPSIDWEQRRWDMYIAVITDAMRWQEYEGIDTSFVMKYANDYTDAYRKEMEEKK